MATPSRVDWRHFLVFYVLAAGAYLWRALSSPGVPLIKDTDDAMRLVDVRDLLAGQGWFDHMQYRMNAPFGAELHWSRLVDTPLAGLLALFRPILGSAGAETATVYIWPLLLLGVLMWLSARVSTELAGPEGELPGLTLPALSLITMIEFAPGRIDHHSVQIVLALVMLLGALGAIARPGWAIVAGVAAGAALAVGVEALPAVAATVLAFGIGFVLEQRLGGALWRFGLTFAGATLALHLLQHPPGRWLATYCDQISMPFAAAALMTGAAFVLLPRLQLVTARARLVAGAAFGMAVLAALYLLAPDCFRAPYANLDPYLISHWIGRIEEAKPIWQASSDDLPHVVAVSTGPLLALLTAAWLGWRRQGTARLALVTYGLFLVTAIAVMAMQVRGERLATSLALPGTALMIVVLRERFLARRRPVRLAALAAAWLGSAGIVMGLAAALASTLLPAGSANAGPLRADTDRCRLPESFAPLAAMPAARVMAPVDLGSHILMFTPHSVVGAPYHRNGDGVLDTYRFFNAPIAEARAIATRRGLTLLVLCPGMPEQAGQPDAEQDALARRLAAGERPDWLVPLKLEGTPLEVYRIAP